MIILLATMNTKTLRVLLDELTWWLITISFFSLFGIDWVGLKNGSGEERGERVKKEGRKNASSCYPVHVCVLGFSVAKEYPFFLCIYILSLSRKLAKPAKLRRSAIVILMGTLWWKYWWFLHICLIHTCFSRAIVFSAKPCCSSGEEGPKMFFSWPNLNSKPGSISTYLNGNGFFFIRIWNWKK